ncbi:hypothetical protein QBC45DRAFT_445687 [Copromyces sp. CBS 386.78]|nr:hypothetical protein QBC45DRAFT_445687 [Copromyces sp. CBS 386.78]
MPSPIYPEPHSCARCSSPKLVFSFDASANGRTGMDTEMYMFDLLHDEAVTLAEDSLLGEGDGCAFIKWLTSKLPAVRDAPGQGQLQALVGRHGSIKTHLYLQWVDGRYTPWLWTFRSVDGLHRPSVAADDKNPTRRKGTDNVRQKLPGQTRFHPIRIEDEPEVMGVLEKDWQEEPEGQGHYLLADDVPVDDSDDEFLDEMGENANYVVGGTDSIKVVLCASQEVLGFNYIWIDAFCIIQNDIRDKHEEIRKMGGIYENAEVTISASRASTCHDGLLQSRNQPGEGSFLIPFRCRAGQSGTVLLWQNRSEQWDEPIDHRGWTLQESLISSRMLEFGTHQTRWHCNCDRYGVPHASKVDYLVDGWTRDKVERSPVSIDWAPVVELEDVDRFRARVPTQTHRRLEERVMQTWKRLIRNYTRRAVSDPMDRLPALSAIAGRLKGLSTCRYAGGLWFGDVPRLIFWYPVEIGSMRRSPERAAPSWSWASVIGAVDFMDVEKTDISVLTVSQKQIILWGMLCRATVCRTGFDPEGSFYTGTSAYEDRHPFEGIAIMEVPGIASKKGQHTESMYLLEVDRDGGTGLVLRRVTEGVYCRAGRYSAMRKKGATYQPFTSSGSTAWAPRRYFTRARLTLI